VPNFIEISQSTAEIKLLPVSKHGWPPYWIFMSSFDSDVYVVVIGMSVCICLPNFVVIGRSAAEFMTSYLQYFSRWQPAAILDLIWVMLDHTRSGIFSLSLILKFGLNPVYSFGDIAIFIFCCFGLKSPIHAHFGGFWGHTTQIWPPLILTSNGPSLRGNTSFEP